MDFKVGDVVYIKNQERCPDFWCGNMMEYVKTTATITRLEVCSEGRETGRLIYKTNKTGRWWFLAEHLYKTENIEI